MPNYNFKKPPEWEGLMQAAAQVTDPAVEHNQQHEAAAAIWDYAETAMGPEAQELNRYYGMGKIICSFAQEVMRPEGRAALLEQATDAVVSTHSYYCQEAGLLSPYKGLYVNELGHGAFGDAGRGLAAVTYATVPLHERMALNVLAALSFVNPPYRTTMKADVLHRLMASKTEPALESVYTNALAGAAATYQAALLRMYERQTGTPVGTENLNPPIAVIANEEAIKNLDLSKVAPVTAGKLRIDEVKHAVDFVKVRDDGTVFADRQSIPELPSPLKRRYGPERRGPAHQNRIGCPALFVPGLIQLATGVMPEVINNAQRRLLPEGGDSITYTVLKPLRYEPTGDDLMDLIMELH